MLKSMHYDILTKKEFVENGEKKKHWFKAGNIKITSNGRIYMLMNHQPNTEFYVFPPQEESLATIN